MPLGPFESEVLHLLAGNRNPDSYVGGATVLHQESFCRAPVSKGPLVTKLEWVSLSQSLRFRTFVGTFVGTFVEKWPIRQRSRQSFPFAGLLGQALCNGLALETGRIQDPRGIAGADVRGLT